MDSDWSIKALCSNISKHTNEDFIHIKHANLLKPITNKLRKRASVTSFEWVKGHNGIIGNENADHLVVEGSPKDNTKKTLFITSPEFNYTGAKLATLTQKDCL